MKKVLVLLLTASVALTAACGGASGTAEEAKPASEETADAEESEPVMLFPRFEEAFVGDTMPFYDNGEMNVFYLADQRDGKTGYHPWFLMRTKDYCTYENVGEVIPYAESPEEQDNALGTGCVIKGQDGKYHAFYTGHNDYYDPAEAVMHAVGDDLTHWTKIPEDTFTAGDNYSTGDFRDPYVFWVESEKQYWMLVMTRSDNLGVIVKYTSTDLHKWKDEGIFFEDDTGFSTNMECPSLLNYKGKWYFAFSDQWPDRVVHYRVADSMSGPFKKPEVDTFDSNGFYAGRLETDGERLFVVGWNPTKVHHEDIADYDWAGNMVIHQLEQQPDGTLRPVVNDNVIERLSNPLDLSPVALTETVEAEDQTIKFSSAEYEIAQFEAFDGAARVEADVTGWGSEDLFGISMAPDIENAGSMSYVFNVKENRVDFYNLPNLFDSDPQSSVDFDLTGRDSFHMTLLICDGVASLYLDGEIALTARMYRSQGTNWQFFGIKSTAAFENVSLYE